MKGVGLFLDLSFATIWGTVSPPLRVKDTMGQLFHIANGSLFIVVFCVCFAAMVTLLEASYHMKMVVQNDSMVPGFAALLILRELGAVITALLLTSRVGAGMAAEVGLMKVTEQIDALKMLGIDPVRFLVVPRFIACVVASIMLTIIANMVCLFCAIIISEWQLGYSPAMFISSMRVFVQFHDLLLAAVKGACFGAVIPLIACHFGFQCQEGAEGVGRATTMSVVMASISIIIIDFILSYTFSQIF